MYDAIAASAEMLVRHMHTANAPGVAGCLLPGILGQVLSSGRLYVGLALATRGCCSGLLCWLRQTGPGADQHH